ncbi:MAG: hypothetical protein RLY40_308 [Pseudomonadota bacterium]|jgi:hypothetical protein
MSKDSLLAEDFFSLHQLSSSEINLTLEELTRIESIIKQKLYPHLAVEQKPIYYQGSADLNELNSFIYQDASNIQSVNFKLMQVELKLTISHIRAWVMTQQLEGLDTLTVFSKRLEQPSDSMALLYGDGKFLLEKIAVLLDEPLIKIEERKNIIVNLLADKELEKCIAGCYSRITSAAAQLQENLDGKLQTKQWLRGFAKIMASQIAAKRPFAMPDTYQVMMCKASDSAVQQNLLHAHNYLLMQARSLGFPVDVERDQGAIELGNGLSELSKKAIINLYSQDLERQITAKNLVAYISEKLHATFTQILAEDTDYADKAARIQTRLNLIGEDSWFKNGKVGLEEILTATGELRSVDTLQTTVMHRLQDRKLLKVYLGKQIILGQRGLVEYYEYNSEVSLTWLWLDNL